LGNYITIEFESGCGAVSNGIGSADGEVDLMRAMANGHGRNVTACGRNGGRRRRRRQTDDKDLVCPSHHYNVKFPR
jgi:hypothetical protein